ncbi:hypothetical protein A3K86_21970 [Photobacterium jeanii]|uniref:N-acetyltransferase domain-containing protein n=1 Tax=Photobacterium jeanii TaxID=858640 RepID=A0A178K3C9_9GAMM|nr:GNAT family N-acetyltransferase [Photobacterium jeanii]OAN11587.1 hypothetical protein A3K86_21970 [Photobacterium jeanii]PST91109.1 N-acetyltransferase [Photobacterium jeanii]
MEIREAIVEDTASIVPLVTLIQTSHQKLAPARFRLPSEIELAGWISEEIEAKDTKFYIAVSNNTVIGYLTLKIEEQQENIFLQPRVYAYIDHVCVAETVRKQGICRQLMMTAIEYSKQKGINDIEMTVWTENTAANNAFKELGFKSTVQKLKAQINATP